MTRIFAEAFGCSSNFADYEIASGLLKQHGFELVYSPEDADIIVIFTCVVKTPTENKMIRRIKEHKELNKPLVVAGCMPKAEQWLVEDIAPDASLLGPDAIFKVAEVVDETLKGSKVRCLENLRTPKTCLPRVRVNPVVHIAPIASGCLGNCSYCIVKLARGGIFSYSSETIVEDTSMSISSGAKEIWVTAQDTAAYHAEGVLLPELLERLSALDGQFRIRVGMMTPNLALPILSDLIKAFQAENVFKFLHVPVQSGNDEILDRMNRQYTVDDFIKLVARFREQIPGLSLSTDIICGFPRETQDQFRDSIQLVEEVEPDVLNISRFGARPGTGAAHLGWQVPGGEIKRRSTLLADRWRKIARERNEKWLGWKGEVLVDEEGKAGSWVGRNCSYKPVVLKEKLSLGSFVEAQVYDIRPQYLLARTLS